MEAIVFALIIFCVVILVVASIYISSTLRHKERMALLEKDKDPHYFDSDLYMMGVIKWGLVLFCGGLGFLTAFLLNYYVFPGNEGEAVFPAFLFMGAGSGLMIFYNRFKK